MQKYDINMAKHFQVRRRWNNIWKRITMALASVVVFCTVYALILPAITMEPEYICGQESHLHTEACYQLPELTTLSSLICTSDTLGVHNHTPECYDENGEPKCGIADFVLHTHHSDCFDVNGELVCSLPEIKAHIHDEACWQHPHVHDEPCFIQQHGELLCTLEEGSLHTHLDTCYIQQQNLICSLPETESHTHTTEACYTETKTLLCNQSEVEAHTHSDNCYTIETIQICSQEETEGHTHGDGCFAEDGSTICVLPEIASHTHTDACFQTTSNFTCTLTETAGHSHSDTCYSEPTSTLICTTEETDGHTHSDTCYETVSVVTCALEENIPHAHTDSCFVCTPVLQCAQPTGEDAVSVLNCEKKELILHTHESACFDQTGACVCGLLEISEHIHDYTCFVITQAQTAEPVLVCDYEEHEHTEVCIAQKETDNIITSDQLIAEGFYCGIAKHIHKPENGCFVEDGMLMCTMTEHEHTELCNLDPAKRDQTDPADDWTFWLESMPAPTGVAADDLLEVARLQLDYRQSADYYTVTEEEEILYYNRYAGWWASLYDEVPYGDWNAKLIAFCLSAADIPFPLAETPSDWLWDPELADYLLAEGELPFPADIVFLDNNRVGIVTAVDAEKGKLDVILEWNGKVREKTFALDKDVLALARIPGNQPEGSLEPLPGEIVLPEQFVYEDEWLTMVLTVEGNAALPEGAVLSEETLLPEPVLTVQMLDDESDLYWQLMDAAQEHGEEGGLLGLTAMELQFWYGEYLLDTTACAMTAQITLKETLLAPPVQTYSLRAAVPTPAPEAETGVEVAVIQADGTAITGTDTAFFETGAPSPTMTFAVTNNVIAVATSTTANPHFTVQYYANIPRVQWSDTATTSGTLQIINTEGGNLPKNGQSIPMKYLRLDNNMTVLRQNTLTEVYAEHNYEYITAPNLIYFNRLYENANYSLKEVWMLKSGRSAESMNREDWNFYNPNTIHFTNRDESVSDTTILIDDGAIIRLVYDTTQTDYQNKVNFYDYDITDGKLYTTEANARAQSSPVSSAAAGTKYFMKSDSFAGDDQEGINSHTNYGSTGIKFAFGNANTRVKLCLNSWNGQTLNKANSNNATACTYGIASTLTNGKIQYADGIAVPKLFDDGAALGKTEFPNCTLEFGRVGDTYTLKKVYDKSGTVIDSGLDTFTERTNWNKTKIMYANDFWPLDKAHSYTNNYASGHDMLFGATENQLTFVGAPYDLSDKQKNDDGLENNPTSDDAIDHNAYFGMQYAVNFELTEDYIGPLEYLFFGDDDMWVFLTHPNGKCELICDIGGVHSSVGEYVNLWDYIDDDASGTHTLSFYYTERGASGSSCYMQFTLPSVSSATPEQSTGHLRVEKEVAGAVVDQEKEYHFDIKFTDAAGNRLLDEYSYTRYAKDGRVIKTDIILYDGGSFELRGGEYIIVRYLPNGAKYEITEANPDNSFITTVNGVETATVSGTIEKMNTEVVRYTNTFYYELPETGGGGAANYWICGGLLAIMPCLWLLRRQRYRGRRVTGG